MTTPLAEGMPFGSVAIDRQSERRGDAAWIAAPLRADPRAQLLTVTGDLRVAADDDGLRWGPIPDDLDPDALVFLGTVEEIPSFAVDAASLGDEAIDPAATVAVREAVSRIDGAEAAALLQATGVISWHRRHPFCAVCGEPSAPAEAGHVRRCPACGTTHFPRTDPAVIMLVNDGTSCVLGQRSGAPNGRWSTLAGYVEPGESLEAAVAREVFEEVGLTVDSVTYVGSQPWPFPASLMVAFEATAERAELVINDEHSAVRWFDREELRLELAGGSVAVPGSIAAGGYLIRRWLG